MDYKVFRKTVYDYYDAHGRNLPWRLPQLELNAANILDPYAILVSEVMLQQTQVNRVVPKFSEFLSQLPDVESLAQAPLSKVLSVWSGLGYNRRAQFLHSSARSIVKDFNGVFPKDMSELIKLPGVGKNTAAAILAYSFNQPVAFIETNIRTVYLHHFFPDSLEVSDRQLEPLIEQTLDSTSPRHWYRALMDYGSFLKSTMPNPNRRSKHHKVQTSFVGSTRQLRGQVIKQLLSGPLTLANLSDTLPDKRLRQVLATLVDEGLISKYGQKFQLQEMIQ